MRFNKTVQYGLKVMISMIQKEDDLYTAKYLHAQLGIPYKYLTHIMTKLAKSGILVSIKGRGGGFRLGDNYKELKLVSIVNIINENKESKECILGGKMCSTTNSCALHESWKKPKEDIDDMLENTYLIDLKVKEVES